MLALLVWAVAAGLALIVLASLGYGLYGQVSRLRRAAEQAAGDVLPKVAALRPETRGGRHRAA